MERGPREMSAQAQAFRVVPWVVAALRQQAEVLRIDGPPDEAAAAEAKAGRIGMEFRLQRNGGDTP